MHGGAWKRLSGFVGVRGWKEQVEPVISSIHNPYPEPIPIPSLNPSVRLTWSCVGIHVLSICSATIPIHCVISGRWRSTMSSNDGIVASPTGTATSITLARSATNAAAPILVTAQPFVIRHVKTANGPSASSLWASPLETPGIFVSTSHTMRGSRRPLKLTLAMACTFPSNDLGPLASVVGFFTALNKTSLICRARGGSLYGVREGRYGSQEWVDGWSG